MGVTGIGGFFFRAEDPKALGAWYAEHLGVGSGKYGKSPRIKIPSVAVQPNIGPNRLISLARARVSNTVTECRPLERPEQHSNTTQASEHKSSRAVA